MNKYVRNVEYKVPFVFCKECKAFSEYRSEMTCLKDDGCKEAVRLYKKYARRGRKDGERNLHELTRTYTRASGKDGESDARTD